MDASDNILASLSILCNLSKWVKISTPLFTKGTSSLEEKGFIEGNDVKKEKCLKKQAW